MALRFFQFKFRKRLSILIVFFLCSQWALEEKLWAEAVPGEFLVKYKSLPSPFIFKDSENLQFLNHHRNGRYLKVFINPAKEVEGLGELLQQIQVDYIVPNAVVRIPEFVEPKDRTSNKSRLEQYSLEIAKARKAWESVGFKGSKNITVAVIDTGVDYRHRDLRDNVSKEGKDYFDKDEDPMDIPSGKNTGHGTHCAGVVGASGQFSDGVSGVSPQVTILPLRFLGPAGNGNLDNSIKAIDYAIEKKADVISASWGAGILPDHARLMIEAIERANSAGIVFVAAAANSGEDNDSHHNYPSNAPTQNMIAVAATDADDAKPEWSNFGLNSVHIGAPGHEIISTIANNDKYGKMSGTSMATPFVAGTVALIRGLDPELKPFEIRSLLESTGDPIKANIECRCRVNVLNALTAVKNRQPFFVPAFKTMQTKQDQVFQVVYGKGPFQFKLSNPKVGTIDADGRLTATQSGETKILATDATGFRFESKTIKITGKDDPQPPGEKPSDCPFQKKKTCDYACKVDPTFSWCKP